MGGDMGAQKTLPGWEGHLGFTMPVVGLFPFKANKDGVLMYGMVVNNHIPSILDKKGFTGFKFVMG